MDYLALKTIHIISSTILFGTGIGSAFYMFMANRRKEISGIAFTTRHVVIADWFFTAPSVVIQLITGIALMKISGYTLDEEWIFYGLVFYIFAGACWLPVIWIQIKMRDMAKMAMENNSELPALYWKYNKWWLTLGSLAFPAIIIVFYLMVFRPS